MTPEIKKALDLALEALGLYQAAGFGDSTDFNKQHEAFYKAQTALTAVKQARTQTVQEPVGEKEISAWAERHDIQGTPTDLRSMFEDAASFTTPPAQPAGRPTTATRCSGCDLVNGCPEFCKCNVAQPAVQEPVAVIGSDFQLLYCREDWAKGLKVGDALCLCTPAAAPVPLTDEQINKLRKQYGVTSNGRGIKEFTYVVDFARAIEAARGITKGQP